MWNVRYVWMHSLRHFQGHQGKSTRLYINIIRCWSGQLNSQLLFNPQPAPWQINALMHPEQDQTWSVQTRSDLRSWPGWVRGPRGVVRSGWGDHGGSSGVGEGTIGGRTRWVWGLSWLWVRCCHYVLRGQYNSNMPFHRQHFFPSWILSESQEIFWNCSANLFLQFRI